MFMRLVRFSDPRGGFKTKWKTDRKWRIWDHHAMCTRGLKKGKKVCGVNTLLFIYSFFYFEGQKWGGDKPISCYHLIAVQPNVKICCCHANKIKGKCQGLVLIYTLATSAFTIHVKGDSCMLGLINICPSSLTFLLFAKPFICFWLSRHRRCLLRDWYSQTEHCQRDLH